MRPVPCRGFTLMELVVVLTILFILLGGVVPLFQGSISWARGDRASRDFVALMKHAQERAVADATEYRFYMNRDTGRYWLMRFRGMDGEEKVFEPVGELDGGVRVLPESVELERPEAHRDRARDAYYIAFHASGACDYASVALERSDGVTVRIKTKGRLGQFEVDES